MHRTDRRLDRDEVCRIVRLKCEQLPDHAVRSPELWDGFRRRVEAEFATSNPEELQFIRAQLGMNRRLRLQMQLNPEFNHAEGVNLAVVLSDALATARAFHRKAKSEGWSTHRSEELLTHLEEVMDAVFDEEEEEESGRGFAGTPTPSTSRHTGSPRGAWL